MKLTRAGEYAIRCVLYLAKQPKGSVSLLGDICEKEDSPKFLTAKVLQRLVQGGILHSSRGAGGGYSLAKDSKKISMLDVVECIEGTLCMNDCLREGGCDIIEKCSVHPVWTEAQNKFREVLASYNFYILANRRQFIAR